MRSRRFRREQSRRLVRLLSGAIERLYVVLIMASCTPLTGMQALEVSEGEVCGPDWMPRGVVKDGQCLFDALVPSTELCPIPELDNPATATVTIEPGKYATWSAVFALPVDDIFLLTGDYRSMGPVYQSGPRSTQDLTRRTLVHCLAAPCFVETLELRDGADRFVLSNLTIDLQTIPSQIRTVNDVVVDRLTLTHASSTYGLRLLSANNVCVQRSTFGYHFPVPFTDNMAIQVKPITPMSGVKIIDNEIFDWVDGIAVTAHNLDPMMPVSNVKIEGNDIYLTPTYQECGENGIDIKAGSDTATVSVTRNRLWGFRQGDTKCAGSGSLGDAILVHVAARNVEIQRNIVFDAPRAYRDKLRDDGLSRHVEIDWNLFYGLTTDVFDFWTDARMISNTISASTAVCEAYEPPFVPGPPTWIGNALVDTPEPIGLCGWIGGYLISGSTDIVFQRKRWTGIESVVLGNAY